MVRRIQNFLGLFYPWPLLSSKATPFLLFALSFLLPNPPLPLGRIGLAFQIHLVAEVEALVVTRDDAGAVAVWVLSLASGATATVRRSGVAGRCRRHAR